MWMPLLITYKKNQCSTSMLMRFTDTSSASGFQLPEDVTKLFSGGATPKSGSYWSVYTIKNGDLLALAPKNDPLGVFTESRIAVGCGRGIAWQGVWSAHQVGILLVCVAEWSGEARRCVIHEYEIELLNDLLHIYFQVETDILWIYLAYLNRHHPPTFIWLSSTVILDAFLIIDSVLERWLIHRIQCIWCLFTKHRAVW